MGDSEKGAGSDEPEGADDAPGRKTPNTLRIRELNDALRRAGPRSDAGVRWMITSGVQALGLLGMMEALEAVQTFTAFEADNDPHQEHDFGAFSVGDARLFWKIDYYDRTLQGGSPDPGDPEQTCRVLTIMLVNEY